MTDIEKKIGYSFKNRALLDKALTHSSYVNGKHNSNERLEFLGDSVLSVVVSKFLFESLDVPEGLLTKIRAKLVCEDTLYVFAKRIDLGLNIKLGKGEESTGGRDRKSILADAFEALIAAIYLDSKFVIVAIAKDQCGQEKAISISKSVHVITAGNLKYGNFSAVSLSKKKVTVKKKKSVLVKAKKKKAKKTKVKEHRKLSFESSDSTIATVNARGKITGKKKGKCTIYVYAQNGVFTKVSVTVK